jgi:capsular polysaccharide biosynthesis protein
VSSKSEESLSLNSVPSQSAGIAAWCPPENGIQVSLARRGLPLRRVEQPIGAPDILARIRGTWIGRLYKNHLKSSSVLRKLVIRGWRTLYPVYVNTIAVRLAKGESKRWRPLVKLGDHVSRAGLPTTEIFEAARVETPVPSIIPVKDKTYLVPPHNHYIFPPVYVAEMSDALVYGGSNLVFANDVAVCHDLYDFERDYTSEELHGRHTIDAKKLRMRLLRYDVAPYPITVAATFVDACAFNYAHWLTEVLPRIAAFCSLPQFSDIPLIVDDGLHPNIIESLESVIGTDREVISLPIGRAVQVERLYVTSVAGYVPFERRNEALSGYSHGLFCPQALALIRERMSLVAEALPVEGYPTKIFLRRTSGGRKVLNGAALEAGLMGKDFAFVQPERLTFLQQVALFNRASEVIGPSGAALANLVFAPCEVKCYILIGRLAGTSYWYWQNIACASGKTVVYIHGQLERGGSGIHADFMVDLNDFNEVLGVE